MAKPTYDHAQIEKSAQAMWAEANLFAADVTGSQKDPYYLLFEFPYPSGDIHIGHWYAFALTDIYARFLRMKGKNVLFPMGFDAFGLPAENAAIRNGVDPREWTYANMERMREQIRSMGTSVDWQREVITCEPSYYKWTQWLFGKLYEHKLAERKEAPVKWCPKDQTVLANEQVVDGKCERCGTDVEERRLTQWFFKITEYAERLLNDLDALPWREDIKDAQRAWIGKSEGAKVYFPLTFVRNPEHNDTRDEEGNPARIPVFTTRPDTLYGATYLVLAPDHQWVILATDDAHDVLGNKEEVKNYVDATRKKTERERSENKDKTGVKIEGVVAINPATEEEIPVYVADYVLASYGTGAVMAVPAHDERDYEFATKYGLAIKPVIEGGTSDSLYTEGGKLIDSGEFSGMDNEEAKMKIAEKVGGEAVTNYRIRDWLISRQRYWGCPIPVVYDPEGNAHLIPEEHLPWLLPTDVDFNSGDKAPLASSVELKERVERIFGAGWTPEFDTLDTFVDSSWYYLRYLAPNDENKFSDASLMEKWLPVDRYSGGSEHTTMHLLYARFFHKALYDLALVPTSEPFNERFNRGIILGPDGAKMSKSKGNVVNPDEFVGKYGADAVRMYLAFIGPYNEPGHYPWNLDGVESMRRFLDRVFILSEKFSNAEPPSEWVRAFSKSARKVAEDTERFKFNTAISFLMTALRDLESLPEVPKSAFRDYLKLLAPFAPHLAEHLWELSAGEGSVHTASWPETLDIVEDTATVVVQVNGKRRGELELFLTISEEEAVRLAMDIAPVASALEGKATKRVIYVPGKILNLVV
ncbi:MAG: leucine--tRNA ligase [Candidatus Pacebacteria bacterium]|nr:leucine--tRNA ligase [Candidatus Paceibacterota bacterium]